MANIILQKPVAGEAVALTPNTEDYLVFQFNSSDASLTRTDDDLVLSFEDGSSISLTDFYVAYNTENMPVFIIDGVEVEGKEFFDALDEELMPAAGFAVQGGGTIVSTVEGTLLAGLNRLDGLDQGFENAILLDTSTAGQGIQNGQGGQGFLLLDDLDNSDELGKDRVPENILDVVITEKSLEVIESGYNNSGMLFDSIEFEIIDEPSSLHIVSFEKTTGVDLSIYGTLSYNDGVISFELNDALANSLKEEDILTATYKVTVSDSDGGLVEEEITVTIHGSNDAPTVEVTYDFNDNTVTEANFDNTVTGNIVFDDVDSDGCTLYVEGVEIVETQTIDGIYGRLTVNADGSFKYEKGVTAEQKANVEALGDEVQTESFDVVNRDPHNLDDTATITINIDGENDIVSIDDAKSTSHVTTDDSGLTSATGIIIFTSAETMIGGKITLGNVEYTISSGLNGDFVLTGAAVDSVNGYGSVTLDGLVYNADTGEYTLIYTYDQTSPYLKHDNNTQDNELAANVDSFIVKIEDAKEAANGGENADSITINVSINDDGISLESVIDKNDDYADPTAIDQEVSREIRKGYIDVDGNFVDLGSKTIHYENVDTFDAVAATTNEDGELVSITQGAFATTAFDGIASIEFSIAPDVNGTTKFLQIEGELVVLSDLFISDTGEQYYLIGHISDNNNDGVDDPIFGNDPDQFLQENLYAKVIFDPKTNTWTVEQYKEYDDIIVLEFTATDGDGDKATHNVAVSGTTEGLGPNIIAADELTVNEAGLVDGSDSEIAKGSIELTANDGLQEIKKGDDVLATWNDTTKSWDIKQGSSVVITSINGNAADGYNVQYEYTLPEAIDGDAGNAPNTQEQAQAQTEHETSFDLTFVDKNGDSSEVSIDVTVLDDTPSVMEGTPDTTANLGEVCMQLIEIDLGADAIGASIEINGIRAIWNGASWEGADVINEGGVTSLTFGDVSLFTTNNESWKVEVQAPTDGTLSKDLNIKVTDNDGDEKNITYNNSWIDAGIDPLAEGAPTALATWSTGDSAFNNFANFNNVIHGNDDNEYLTSGANNDIIFGGMGDDIIFAGAGDSTLGDKGNDVFVLQNLGVEDVLTIDGGDGVDILLSGVNNLEVLKGMLQNEGSSLSNTEIIMFGDDLDRAQELQEELTLSKDIAEDFSWKAGEEHSIGGHEYTEYNKEQEGEMYTILMRTDF